MSVEVNGIAHIQMTVNNIEACMPFWEGLCHFLEMKTLVKNETTLYCIGSRTGILIREAPEDKKHVVFDQDTSGLHHFCFRARSNEDIDAIYNFIVREFPEIKFMRGPELGDHFAPGYYSILFEDPDGIRVEFNYVPGKGHFGDKGRLGENGPGPSDRYGEEGIYE
ncbi:MAG: VOC family protein [Pseudomonadales bacterium]|nr:VOC family protein [Pseudomonadales bacterium]MBO6564382.1 VOC family protein [Pseudomonadales bacterium]MBO6596506.1 VOC family protein [Pseudomonadales bacterium]MBO6657614.1 VOC family protein [Pseudomonadales bacterium]MBO6703202.1 VOC family protein [Pseudomonadales bacterium]